MGKNLNRVLITGGAGFIGSNLIKAFVEKKGNDITASLGESVFGIANGQALVIYQDDLVIGGGWISGAH